MPQLTGSCHCQNIEYVFSTEMNHKSFVAQECGCSFCKKHSAQYIFDPNGQCEIVIREDISPIKYLFNLKTAEFISCPTCGTFVMALVKRDDKNLTSINIKTLDSDSQKIISKSVLKCWDGETREQRKSRISSTWTPTVIRKKNLLEHMKVNNEASLRLFIEQFESKTLPKNKWTHEAHFVVALWYSYHFDLEQALEKVRKFISDYNVATGVNNTHYDGYHETITWLYLKTTKDFIESNPNLSTIKLLEKLMNSEIVNKNYPLRFFDQDVIMSPEARLGLINCESKALLKTQSKSFINFSSVISNEIIPGLFAKVIQGEHMTIVYWTARAGSILPEHCHIHEQISNFIQGEFELTVNNATQIMQPGSLAVIKPNDLHSGRAITDCKIIDIFYPRREYYS